MQNILTIVMVLGFLAHGYVTEEFEATEERLGVYLPVCHLQFALTVPNDIMYQVEHIDNPKVTLVVEARLYISTNNYIKGISQ